MNIKNVETVFCQVKTITDSYARLAKTTGENFNIFSVLKIEHYEESTHSRFIATLLNPKGTHGFNESFLNEFLKIVQLENHLDSKTTSVKVEHHIGKKLIVGEDSTGGSIDIYLRDEKGKSITIENKIYATDQDKQIIRYHNHNKENNEVIYLTLFGSDARESSKGKLKSDTIENRKKEGEKADFYLMSYRDDIVDWLEECQKIAVENPVVRETIKQYKHLVKKLTHQNINSQMNKELVQLLLNKNNKNVTKAIQKAIKSIDDLTIAKLQELIDYAQTNKLELQKINKNLSFTEKLGSFGGGIKYMHFLLKIDNEREIYFEFSNRGELNILFLIWSDSVDIKCDISKYFNDRQRKYYDPNIEIKEIFTDLKKIISDVANKYIENPK